MAANIQERLLEYLSQHFGIPRDQIDPEASLVDQGVIDSFGFIEIVLFLEAEFPIVIAGPQITPDHFGSVNRIVAFVAACLDAALPAREPPLVR